MSGGGRILFEFAFPVVRADVPPSLISDLHARSILDHALCVPYSDRRDIEVAAVYQGSATAAVSAFTGAGGQIDRVLENVSIIIGSIPNDSVDGVRAMSEFHIIEHLSARCRAGGG